jgi:hypothetical protein
MTEPSADIGTQFVDGTDWYVAVFNLLNPNDPGITIKSGLTHDQATDVATRQNAVFFSQKNPNKRANVLKVIDPTLPVDPPSEGV